MGDGRDEFVLLPCLDLDSSESDRVLIRSESWDMGSDRECCSFLLGVLAMRDDGGVPALQLIS